ncbi:MAG: hypothetical protein HN945_00655 [Deltaproteobacteria bacterium]|nr:hypothetical protein [Deltaproteobacteria bacterium]
MKQTIQFALLVGLILLGISPERVSAKEDDQYTFDVETFAKKTWEWQGEISTVATRKELNSDSDLYPVKFPQRDQAHLHELNLQLSLESRWDWGWSRLFLAAEANKLSSSSEDANSESTVLNEGYWQFSEVDPHNIEIGKRLLRWGKGYAFNPVSFLERSKNPEDPEASREGLWMVQGIWIPGGFSLFDSSSLTLVYLPVRDDLNDNYQPTISEENFWGVKLYALIGTTDIDLYLIQKNQQEESDWGFDFATNLTSSFEVHGEYAANHVEALNYQTMLLGLRYLTENDVTWIAEAYHDSAGLTKDESRALFTSLESGSPVAVKNAVSLIQQSKTLNQNYSYLKVSVKEPFNWLYFTPSMAWLTNLDDSSTNINTQLAYAPAANWLFQFSWQFLSGDVRTQYGENLIKNRTGFEVAYSF